MPDPIEGAQPTPVASPSPVAAEVVPAVPTAAPEPVAAPEATPAPAEAPAVEVIAEAPAIADRPSLIGEAKTGEAKPEAEVAAETPKPEEAAKPEGEAAPSPEEVKAPEPEPIKYESFKIPDGVELEAEKIGKFTELLGEHRAPQELGQKLVDFHVAEVQAVADRLQSHNWEVWNRQQDDWLSDFRSDREIGGNREVTTLRNCAAVIEQYGGSPEQQAQLRKIFDVTGAGNNPNVIRLLNNIGKVLAEGRPVPATKSPAPQSTRQARRYGST